MKFPLSLQANKIDDLILKQLNLPAASANLEGWHDILHRLRNPEHEVSIALVGKYAEHRDAYKSIYEALDHGGIANYTQVRVQANQRVKKLSRTVQKRHLPDLMHS